MTTLPHPVNTLRSAVSMLRIEVDESIVQHVKTKLEEALAPLLEFIEEVADASSWSDGAGGTTELPQVVRDRAAKLLEGLR